MTLEEVAHNGITTHGQLTADFQDTFFAAMDPHADTSDRETRAQDASFIELLGTTTEYYPTVAAPATFSTQPEKFESQSTGYRSRRPEGALPLVVHEIRDESHELEHPDEELVMREHGCERFETAVQPTTPSRRDSFDRIAKRNRESDTRFRDGKVIKKSSTPKNISAEASLNESEDDIATNVGKSEKKCTKENSKNSAGSSSPKTPRSIHSNDTATPVASAVPKALPSPTSSSGKKVVEPALKVSTTTFSGLITTGPAKPGDPCTLHLSEEAKEAVETQVKEQLKQLKEQRRQMETARAVSEARTFDIPGQRSHYGMLEGDGLDSPRALDSPRHHPYPVWPGHHSPGSSSRDSLIERGCAAESPSADGQIISPHAPVGFIGYVETQLGLGKVLSNRLAMAHTAIQYWAQRASAAGRTADSTPGTAAPGRYDNAHAAMTAATDAATRRHKAEAEAEGLTAIALALYDKWTAIGPASPEKAAAVDIVNTPSANHVQELMNHILRELDSLGGQARRHLSDTLADVIDGQRTDEDAISEARAVLTWFDRARASLRMSFRDQLSHLVIFTPFQPTIKIIQPPSPSARSGSSAYSPGYFAPRSPPISSGPGPTFRAGTGGSAASLVSPSPSLAEAGSKKRGNLPKQAVLNLKTWLFEHFEHPYPSEEEKMQLAAETGLSPTQISNWFINARVRIWRPMIEKASNEVEERKSRGETSPYEAVNEAKGESGVSSPDESTRETRHATHSKSEPSPETRDDEDVDGNAS